MFDPAYEFNAPQGMTLSDLAGNVQQDQEYQKFIMQEKLRRQQEEEARRQEEARQQAEAEANIRNAQITVAEATQRGYRTDTSKEWAGGAIPMIGQKGERITAVGHRDPVVDPYTAAKQKVMEELLKPEYERDKRGNIDWTAPDLGTTTKKLGAYRELAGEMTPEQERKAKYDNLKIMADLAKKDYTLDENGKLAKLPGSDVKTEAQKLKDLGITLSPGQRYDFNSGEIIDIPGGAADKKKKSAAANLTKSNAFHEKTLGRLEGAIGDVLGIPRDAKGNVDRAALENALGQGKDQSVKRIAPAVGPWDSSTPWWTSTTPSAKNDVRSAVTRLKELAQTGGLQELKAAGISPGSITEREWPKFQAMLANLDTSQSEEQLMGQLQNVYRNIQDDRVRMQDEGGGAGGDVPQSGAQSQAALFQEAQDAIARGAPREAVMQRLREKLGGQ